MTETAQRWTHRLAWALAVLVFALLWAGALVTTFDAGMAVPDWPTTYGHWFYPLQKWLYEVNDLFLEHGHRTLAQLVGLAAIGLAVMLWRYDERRGARWLGVAILLGVILQGTLGGLRVLGRSVVLAQIHGCTAPLVFALCTAAVTVTSSRWRAEQPAGGAATDQSTPRRLALVTLAGVYLMIVVGVQLRHQPPTAAPFWLTLWIWIKVIGVAAVSVPVAWLFVRLRSKSVPPSRERARVRAADVRAWSLLGVFSVQVLLGLGTWVVNYGFPAWFRNYVYPAEYTIVRDGALQVWTTTGHMAIGALTFAVAMNIVLWLYRDRLS
jgi:cytochrome c oxidase assembly protein subunit 15